tara:strand:+ start:64 stop:252 length:189 start_codon:yes stop_codon:yes gene_type:complete
MKYQAVSSDIKDFSEPLELLGITSKNTHGAIAQLVEHLHGMQGVSGSSPLGSIDFFRISKGF